MHGFPLDTTIDSVVGYLRRRRRSALVLTTGEAATLAIGVVRGCANAPTRASGGRWLLTAEGRPFLEHDPEGEDVLTATVAVLDEVVSLVDADVRPGFRRLRDGVLTEPPRTWVALERKRLAVVEPAPLVLGPLAPNESADGPARSTTSPETGAARPSSRWAIAVARVRPRAVLTGVGVAAILGVGVMSIAPSIAPAGAEGRVAPGPSASPTVSPSPLAQSPRPEMSAPGEPAHTVLGPADTATSSPPAPVDVVPPAPGEGTTGAASSTEDVRTAALDVLTSFAHCTSSVCEAALTESAAGLPGPEPLDPTRAALELIDDFGGVAVIRLSERGRSQYVTLVQENDRWLIRSVEDVADQPS